MTVTGPIFTDWQDRPLEQVLGVCRDAVEDPGFPLVRAWREAGGRTVGHFQVYFPEEIVHAAGLLPVKVCGADSEGVESTRRFGSYLCSILKTSLDATLTGALALDMFVAPPICDGARNLAGVWGRNFPYKCQMLHLPQNPNSSAAIPFLREEYARLAHDLEELSGRPVDDVALRESIGIYNTSRRLMRELYRIRRETPWKLSADESLALLGVGGLMPREEFNRLLATVLPMIEARPTHAQDKMRVVFEGGFCEVPPFDLLQAVSRSCYVVDDDLHIGLRWLQHDVPLDGDPLASLARAYVEDSSYSPVQHDRRKPKERMLLERITSSGAEAAILAAAKMCEPGLDEQVAYSKMLDQERIPYFITEFEENQNTFDDLAIQLETFVENIMFD